VALAYHDTGAGDPLVILHGLFGSKRNWASVARRLGGQRRVLTVDLRNHGESPWDDRHDYPALADDVAQVIEAVLGRPAAVLGHSMGGKAAMILAVSRPELVERLVVVDIPPAESAGDTRRCLEAMRAVPLKTFTRRAEVETALAAAIPDPAIRAFLAANVVSRPEGLAWGVNLEALARQFETIRGFPEIPPGRRYDGPTLFVAGGRSHYLLPDHTPAITRLFPAATIEVLTDAGHWVHAEAPDAFVAAVGRFLSA
jgi:esterase